MSKKEYTEEKEELRKKSASLFEQLRNKEQEWEMQMMGAKAQANSLIENAKLESDTVLKEARDKRAQIRQEYEAKKKAREKAGADIDEAEVKEVKQDINSPEAKEEEKKIQELKQKAQNNTEKVVTYIIKSIL